MLLPVNSQPRLIKRVKSMVDKGYDVTVAYQIRDYFKKNHLPDDCKKVPLVYIESGKYYRRPFKLLKSFMMLYSLKEKWDIIYTFSFDLLFISSFLSAKNRYYEIGDLRIVDSVVYDVINRRLLKKQDKIFVTSIKFAEFLHEKYEVSKEKVKVVENKLHPEFFAGNRKNKSPITHRRIRVGIIGLLRYRQVLDFLFAIKGSDNRLEVHIYGSGVFLEKVQSFVDGKNVFYHGEFSYPVDLDNIYQNVDISFVMYNSEDLNVRLALPNKLYESIYYKTPLIVSSSTYLAEKVKSYGVGLEWDIRDMQNLPAAIENVFKNSMYEKYVENCDRVNMADIFSTSDLS